MKRRVLLVVQLFAVLGILALVPGNGLKLAAFVAVWAATFWPVSRPELVFFGIVCVLFSVMNVGALGQGVFYFRDPDYLGMPIYEFFMWGFYLLHAVRFVGGPAPGEGGTKLWLLVVAFAIPFSTIADPTLLFFSTFAVLALALYFYHERHDWIYLGYLALVGAMVEYVGVWFGQWGYPGDPAGGVPPWFLTMWGGIGLFVRRLAVPILYHFSSTAPGKRASTE